MIAAKVGSDRQVIADFVAALRDAGYTVTTTIWFGSRARGERDDPRSDYNLIVVVPEFGAQPWVRRLVAAYACWPAAYAADILCYTPEEFAALAQRASIVREAMQTGIVVDRSP